MKNLQPNGVYFSCWNQHTVRLSSDDFHKIKNLAIEAEESNAQIAAVQLQTRQYVMNLSPHSEVYLIEKNIHEQSLIS